MFVNPIANSGTVAAVRDSVRPAIPGFLALAAAVVVIVPLLISDQRDASADSDCRSALRAEHLTSGLWWRIGQRPNPCSELSNTEFASLAAEVTDDTPWDRCRSDLHALFVTEHTWAEPGRFPDACHSFHKAAFDQVSLEAGQWSMQDSYIEHGWPVEVIGEPTARPSEWREMQEYAGQ